MDNLNQYLQPINSPVGQASPFDLAMNFQIYNDRDIIGNAQVSQIQAGKIGAGTVIIGINIGSTNNNAYVKLDGANNRIIVNDGTTNRVVIGSV